MTPIKETRKYAKEICKIFENKLKLTFSKKLQLDLENMIIDLRIKKEQKDEI